MNRPLSITVIAFLFILGGFYAVFGVIADFLRSHINIDLTVLFIPMGFGLLKGRSSSLGWARFSVGLYLVVFAAFLILYPFIGHRFSVHGFSGELTGTTRHLVAIGFPLLSLIPGIVIWRCLYSPKIAPFFDNYVGAQSRIR